MQDTPDASGRHVGQLQAAAQSLISAIREHVDEMAKITEEEMRFSTGPSAGEALTAAIQAYDDVYSIMTGKTLLPSGDLYLAGEDAVVSTSGRSGKLISILTRTDYLVEDTNEIIAAGRRSYRWVRPESTDDEVNAEVADIGAAIYEILHTNDDQIPFPFPAAEPIAGIAWFMEIERAMPQGVFDEPNHPFEIAEEGRDHLLYVHRNVYMPQVDE